MIKCKYGTVHIEGGVVETMADLACIVKAIQSYGAEKDSHPVRLALMTLKYVGIGLTYRGEA